MKKTSIFLTGIIMMLVFTVNTNAKELEKETVASVALTGK
jgi:hypothetical protein